jgi:hypothetical protein
VAELFGLLLLRAAPEYLALAGCIVAPCLVGWHLATKSSDVKGTYGVRTNAVKTNSF